MCACWKDVHFNICIFFGCTALHPFVNLGDEWESLSPEVCDSSSVWPKRCRKITCSQNLHFMVTSSPGHRPVLYSCALDTRHTLRAPCQLTFSFSFLFCLSLISQDFSHSFLETGVIVPWYLPKGAKNLCAHKNLHTDVSSSLIHNRHTWKQTRCPSVGDGCINLVPPNNSILFSTQKKWTIKPWKNMKDP